MIPNELWPRGQRVVEEVFNVTQQAAEIIWHRPPIASHVMDVVPRLSTQNLANGIVPFVNLI